MKIKIRVRRGKRVDQLKEVLQEIIADYSESYRRVLSDPTDEKAKEIMDHCENIIMLDPDFCYLIGNPLDFLYKLDQRIEADHERRMRCLR